MSLASVKQSAMEVTEEERRELMAYLHYVSDQRRGDLEKRFAALLDDQTPGQWLEWSLIREEMRTAP